ncbi:MAG: tRNA (adenosine(37)-N6)-threonylcarbamoyltransferase complex transferase subunit TsaD [bacterium]|nr:tRNA (adenosine(37)-N6)-threonylcarbamoyltransferase complex transferase subunit TsaD [bacterium]
MKWVLGIESSCDETAAALWHVPTRRFFEVIARQLATHAPYGGVVPELASRCHLETVAPLVQAVCRQAGITLGEIDAVAATAGPGLAGALIVGLSYGKALAAALGKPFVAVNHIEAHMVSACAEQEVPFPFVALVVSGGHTLLADVEEVCRYRIIGRTRDDAAGEAFDKGAKLLGLGYPGGLALARLAERGNPRAIHFPRALMRRGVFDFSFSGLKTALLYYLEEHPDRAQEDVAASYQEAIVDVLARKTIAAARMLARRYVVLGGGVSANAALRTRLQADAKRYGLYVVLPSLPLCTDNARMIAYRGATLLEARGADALTADIFPTFRVTC